MNRDPIEVDNFHRCVRDGIRQSRVHLEQAKMGYKSGEFPLREGRKNIRKEQLEQIDKIIKKLSALEAYISTEWNKAQEEENNV